MNYSKLNTKYPNCKPDLQKNLAILRAMPEIIQPERRSRENQPLQELSDNVVSDITSFIAVKVGRALSESEKLKIDNIIATIIGDRG